MPIFEYLCKDCGRPFEKILPRYDSPADCIHCNSGNVEKQLSGRRVQQAHMKLGRRKQAWPIFQLPEERGEITVAEVLACEPGPGRDQLIHEWCVCVWNVFRNQKSVFVELLRDNAIS